MSTDIGNQFKEYYDVYIGKARLIMKTGIQLLREEKNQYLVYIFIFLFLLLLIVPRFVPNKPKQSKRRTQVDRLKADAEAFRRRQKQEADELAAQGLISTPLGRRSTRQRKARVHYET